MMNPAEAKSRLMELGEKAPNRAAMFGPSVVRLGALLGAGFLAGRWMARRHDSSGRGAFTLATSAKAAATALAPLLIREFARGIFQHATARANRQDQSQE